VALSSLTAALNSYILESCKGERRALDGIRHYGSITKFEFRAVQ